MISRREFLRISGIFSVPLLDLKGFIPSLFLTADNDFQLVPDIVKYIIRPDDLLDLEFNLFNVQEHSDGSLRLKRSSVKDVYMIVRLPKLHVAEKLYGIDEAVDDTTTAASYVAGDSYLAFKFRQDRNLSDFQLTSEMLLDWSSNRFFELLILDQDNYPSVAVDYHTKTNFPGLGMVAKAAPVTTFEVPYGLSLAPVSYAGLKTKALFVFDNTIKAPSQYYFDKNKDTEDDVFKAYKEAMTLTTAVKDQKTTADTIRLKKYTELWYNDLVLKNTSVPSYKNKPGVKPSLKIIGYNDDINHDPDLLPTYTDKRDMYTQFTEHDDNSLKNEFSDRQLIDVYAEQFRISALGLNSSIDYVSPNGLALLQKFKEEIKYGRDSYIEVQRLGYMYPLGIRVVQVTTGTRVLRNGAYIVERRQYIAPLEKVVVYRDDVDQDDQSIDSSVLRRETTGVYQGHVNYVRSVKRSLPFQKIEVLTDEFIELHDLEGDLKNEISTAYARLYGQLNANVNSYLDKATAMLKVIKANKDKFRNIDGLESAIGNDLFHLADNSTEANFIRLKFDDIIGAYSEIKAMISAFQKLPPVDTAELSSSVSDLANIVAQQLDDDIDEVKSSISEACEEGVRKLNKTRNGIASIKNTGIDRLNAFWPLGIDRKDVMFKFQGTDWDGKKTKFEASFVMVNGEAISSINKLCIDRLDKRFQQLINHELVLIQQELAKYQRLLAGYLKLTDKAIKKDEARLDALTASVNKLLRQIYNRSQELSQSTDARVTAIVTDIADLGTKDVGAIEAELSGLQARINALDAGIQSKLQHYLFASVLYLSGKSILDNDVTTVKDRVESLLNSADGKIKQLEQTTSDALKAEWYDKTERFYLLDEQLTSNYHAADNALKRQINIENEKVAYYKSIADDAAGTVEQKINDLETQLIEFAAVPIAKVTELRFMEQNIVDNQLQLVRDFGKRYSFTYPQLLSATVHLPIVNEIEQQAAKKIQSIQEKMQDEKNAVIAYADAYRLAGIQGWQAGQSDLQKNAERILFAVKKNLASFNDVNDISQSYERDLTDKWQQIANQSKDFEARAIGYMAGQYNNALTAAQDKMAGLIQPGVAVQQISAIKGKAFVLYNDINTYTGEINSYVKDKTGAALTGLADVKDFERQIDGYLIKRGNYLKELLGDVQIFGLDIFNDIVDLGFSPGDVPNAQVTIGKKNDLPINSTVIYKWQSPQDKQLIPDGTGPIKFINGSGKIGKDPKFVAIDLTVTNFTSWESESYNDLTSTIGVGNFGIGAADVIQVYFEHLRFEKKIIKRKSGGDWMTNSSTAMDIKVGQVVFQDFLTLIQKLQDALGLGKGFVIDLSPSGLKLTYGIRLPTISTGAFTMANLSLYAGLALSFTGEAPALAFSFADRPNPFTMAAGIFGGRGFFGLEVSSSGVREMEGALEYGGYMALDIAGIAKGQAYLMVGIYFRQTQGQGVFIEAYVTCGGSLSIIGIIQVSIVFYLSMSYQDKALIGRASVEVSISILFFSASYSLQYEKRITGGNAAIWDTSGYDHDQIYYVDSDKYALAVSDIDQVLESEGVYAYLYVEDGPDEWDSDLVSKLVPVYDPTVIYEEEMDFDKYIKQFSLN